MKCNSVYIYIYKVLTLLLYVKEKYIKKNIKKIYKSEKVHSNTR